MKTKWQIFGEYIGCNRLKMKESSRKIPFLNDGWFTSVIINNYNNTYMSHFPYFDAFNPQIYCQFPSTSDLVRIREIYFNELQNQLWINRMLLEGKSSSPAPQTQTENTCSSRQTKFETKISEEEFEYDSSLVDSKTKIRSLKNKISHNSSLRNDTKNIPKNYGKAILTFIQKSAKSRKLTAQMGLNFSDFMMQVRRIKKKVNSIEGLRKMWGSDSLTNQVKKCIRILSYEFMRKHCLRYIFHSKVRNYGTHIKYRQKLIEGIENPSSFTHIKDYW